ncbi:RNA polymerase sigma factor [Mesonia sediminis]|uniref:RNA polymerase sigma factor n=1 Tax=Mesonia sediminis TaxID=1703946 RepID=A0ABW5SEH0_9FLAO
MKIQNLIRQCQKQDLASQEQLYHIYNQKLFSVALKYARNYKEAEDHLQDSFITIFKKINQFKFKGSFEGWMKRIVINTCLQAYRKEPFFEIINENQIKETEEEIEDHDLPLDFLLKIVQELPNRYRLVFNLYALDGYSHKEIAELLHISDGTSKSNLARARQILRQKVEAYQNLTNQKSV